MGGYFWYVCFANKLMSVCLSVCLSLSRPSTFTRSSAIGMSHACLCLPSCSWYSFTDPGDGRLSRPKSSPCSCHPTHLRGGYNTAESWRGIAGDATANELGLGVNALWGSCRSTLYILYVW